MEEKQLIIFTRYPEPGKTKTRLIPGLGATGAAELQRYLTEQTLIVVDTIKQSHPLGIKIYFTGGNRELMSDWLGKAYSYYQQEGKDLGERLQTALQEAIATGAQKVVIIGSDCLELTPSILIKAFSALSTQDLVLGPARDGGYYLIGLSRWLPQLFLNIPWGTSEVFATTTTIAQGLQLNYLTLPILSDIDFPQDLSPQLLSRFSR